MVVVGAGLFLCTMDFVYWRSHETRYRLREEEIGRLSVECGALQGMYQARTADLEASRER